MLHHSKVDQDEDPHSPRKGFFYALITWYFLYSPKKIQMSSARNLARSRVHHVIHKHYLALFWLPIMLLLAVNAKIAFLVFIFPAILSFWQENLINSICHIPFFPLNYRSYSSRDNSRNNLFLGYVVWGAGFHNNHHDNPKTYSFAKHWFEFDICKQVVGTLLFIDRMSRRA